MVSLKAARRGRRWMTSGPRTSWASIAEENALSNRGSHHFWLLSKRGGRHTGIPQTSGRLVDGGGKRSRRDESKTPMSGLIEGQATVAHSFSLLCAFLSQPINNQQAHHAAARSRRLILSFCQSLLLLFSRFCLTTATPRFLDNRSPLPLTDSILDDISTPTCQVSLSHLHALDLFPFLTKSLHVLTHSRTWPLFPWFKNYYLGLTLPGHQTRLLTVSCPSPCHRRSTLQGSTRLGWMLLDQDPCLVVICLLPLFF